MTSLYSEKARNTKGKRKMKKVEKIEKMGLTIGLRSGIVCKLLRNSGAESGNAGDKSCSGSEKSS